MDPEHRSLGAKESLESHGNLIIKLVFAATPARLTPGNNSPVWQVNFYEQPTRTGLKLNFIAEIDDEGEMSGKTWQAGAYNETATFNNGFYYGNLEPGIGDWTGHDLVHIYSGIFHYFMRFLFVRTISDLQRLI